MDGAACPAASLCVFAANKNNLRPGGGVVTSTNPTGGASAWSHADVTGSYLNVPCPGPSGSCAAVDEHGAVATSSDPAGGPGAWSVTPLSAPGISVEHNIAPRRGAADFQLFENEVGGRVTGFECSLVTPPTRDPAFKPCGSPMKSQHIKKYRDLAPGRYRFEARGVNEAFVSAPQRVDFRIRRR